MGRTKGSKNKPKVDLEVPKIPVKKEKIKIDITSVKEGKPRKMSKEEIEEPEVKPQVVKEKVEKYEPKAEGVSPRKESPKIPEVLVDGGMLYRWLLELRRHYDDYLNEDTKDTKKQVYKVIDEIMEYIMRMDKT